MHEDNYVLYKNSLLKHPEREKRPLPQEKTNHIASISDSIGKQTSNSIFNKAFLLDVSTHWSYSD